MDFPLSILLHIYPSDDFHFDNCICILSFKPLIQHMPFTLAPRSKVKLFPPHPELGYLEAQANPKEDTNWKKYGQRSLSLQIFVPPEKMETVVAHLHAHGWEEPTFELI